MINIRDSIDNSRVHNLVQSVITMVLNAQIQGYPNINGCVRYLSSFVDKRPVTDDVAALVGKMASHLKVQEKADPNGIVNLIVRIHHASREHPELLASLERNL